MSRCFPLPDFLGYESSILGKTYRLMCGDIENTLCHSPSLGLATKARACKCVAKKKAQESHFILSGVQKSVRE
jgi:hypothetical protein